jgi:hypothetical protein
MQTENNFVDQTLRHMVTQLSKGDASLSYRLMCEELLEGQNTEDSNFELKDEVVDTCLEFKIGKSAKLSYSEKFSIPLDDTTQPQLTFDLEQEKEKLRQMFVKNSLKPDCYKDLYDMICNIHNYKDEKPFYNFKIN